MMAATQSLRRAIAKVLTAPKLWVIEFLLWDVRRAASDIEADALVAPVQLAKLRSRESDLANHLNQLREAIHG